METSRPVHTAPKGDTYLSIREAADRLTESAASEVKPWDVVRLIDAGLLDSLVLVREDSVRAYQEQTP